MCSLPTFVVHAIPSQFHRISFGSERCRARRRRRYRVPPLQLCASGPTTDARGFVLPEEGDVVLYQGRWANEDAAGLVSSVRFVESRSAHIVDVVELRRLSSDLFAVPSLRNKTAKWMDVAEVRVVRDAAYVPGQDAYRVSGTRDGYAKVEVNEEGRRRAEEEYIKLKQELLKETALTGVAGTTLTALVGGFDIGRAFAAGAVGSLLYFAMLQRSVDRVGKGGIGGKLLGLRFLVPVLPFLGLAGLGGAWGLRREEAMGAVLGLLAYKVPLLVRTGGEFVDGLADFEMGKTGMVGMAVGLAARQIKKRRDAKPVSEVQAEKEKPVFVFAGPSGVGKSTLIHRLMEEYPATFSYTVSHTTRQKRPDETDGSDYHFVQVDKFEQMINEGAFVEFAKVHGQYYGTSYAAVETVLKDGGICILDLDVQGVKTLRERGTVDARFVWVAPPSIDALRDRLTERGTEKDKDVKVRIDTAIREMAVAASSDWFDLVVVNDDIERAYMELREFIAGIIDIE